MMSTLSLAALLMFAWDARLATAQSCSTTQLTVTTGTSRIGPGLAINADGTRIAIEAPYDLTGNNADLNNEIFLYDTTTNTFTQITDTMGDVNGLPSISANGSRIVFVSTGDFTGGNADGSGEVFLYDTTLNSFTQVTDAISGRVLFPKISSDGTRIVVDAPLDLTGNNPDLNVEIFLYDTTTSSITQITDTTAVFGPVTNFGPEINADGTRIVFLSEADLTGNNPDHSQEVFLYDATQNSFTQITSVDFSITVGIDDSGTRISFSSTADLTGHNADGNTEVFLYDTSTSSFTQITDTIVGSSVARMSDDGTHLVLSAVEDLTGGNPDGSLELFIYDTVTDTFTQVSNTANVSTAPFTLGAINGDGTRVLYGSGAEMTGSNPDGNLEYYLTTCDDGDSDDDGIPDDSDPDTVADVVITLPNADFRSAGNKNALLGRLEFIESLILAGNTTQAIAALQDLRRRVDGCGTAADMNDWITNCTAQFEVRQLIAMLITNLAT